MLEPGDDATDFTLASTAGGPVTLSDTLSTGPAVLLFNRGTWCSYCAEQLGTFSALAYDLWRHEGVDVLPVFPADTADLVEMRDRFDFRIQLLADPDLDVTRDYTATETSDRHGEIPVATTVVVDGEGTVRYHQIADNPADRTYANWTRAFVANGFEAPYA